MRGVYFLIKSKSNLVFLTVPRRYFFCGFFMFLFCLEFAMSLCTSVYMCIVVTCWERAGLLALVCGVSKGAYIRYRYNQVPHLTQDTNGKVTNSLVSHAI